MQPCPRHLSDVPPHQRMEGVPPPPTGPDLLVSIRVPENRGLTYAQLQLRSGEAPADGGADEIDSLVADGEVAGWWYATTRLPTVRVRVRLPEGKPVTEVPMYRVSQNSRALFFALPPRKASSIAPIAHHQLHRLSKETDRPCARCGRQLISSKLSRPHRLCGVAVLWGDRGATAAPPGRARDWKRCRWQTG